MSLKCLPDTWFPTASGLRNWEIPTCFRADLEVIWTRPITYTALNRLLTPTWSHQKG